MNLIYIVFHEFTLFDKDDTKFIGAYSTQKNAEEAVERLRHQPGFCDWPEGFSIDEYTIDRDNWKQGFSTVVPIHVRVLDGKKNYFECAHAVWIPGDLYRILSFDQDVEQGSLEFKTGQVVKCVEREIDGYQGCFVATEAVNEKESN